MTDAQGGFYSALDAETDGVEGQFYVWSKDEVQKILSANGYRYFAAAYGLEEPQEFEHGYVLHLPGSVSQTAEDMGVPLAELDARLERARTQLLAQRTKRKPLRRDDKILTSWNGLMIRAFARGGQVLQRPEFTAQAEKAALYLLSHSRDREGRLLRSTRDGVGTLSGYLDDYAFFVSGLLALHDATGEEKWLHSARLLTDQQINLFLDEKSGGFYFTSHDHESLIARTKTAYDSVIPSGNSVSIQNLLRLAQLTSDPRYAGHAEKTAQAFLRQLRQTPGNLAYFALAAQDLASAQGGIALAENSANPPDPQPASDPKEKLIPGLAPDPQAAAKDKTVSATGYFGAKGVVAGGSIPVAIVATIADEWHINANPAQPDFVIPTELVAPGDSLVTLEKITYPKGHQFELQGIDQPLSVYEGKVVLKAQLKIPEGVTGEIPVQIQLRYQACNSESCLAPKRLMLSGKLTIIPAGTSAVPINRSLFADGAKGN